MPEIEIQFASEAEYERLRTIRDTYGVTWRGMLLFGAQRLEGRVLPRSRAPARGLPYSDGGTTADPGKGDQPEPRNTGVTRPVREER
jgi:hypothetical protein